ncbi:MAG: hypothetical protein J0H01_32535 [Rhizobiales bacterium]|nr:hypothetical protein [Hyphomicrobiales bacterium]
MSLALSLLLAGNLTTTGMAPPPAEHRLEQAQYVQDRRGNLTGEGSRFGHGYDVSRSRRSRTTTYTGTGRNFGGGYEQRGNRITGTGTRFGGGYDVERNRIVGTGSNFGSGWERHRDGSWYGTGRNFGRSCAAGSNPAVACR